MDMLLPFYQIDEDFIEDDLETNLMRDKHARLCNLANNLIDQLLPNAPDYALRDVCGQLVRLPIDAFEIADNSTSGYKAESRHRDSRDANSDRIIPRAISHP